MRPDLILIGLRGSGKTTLGRAVAAQSGTPFLDLDDALARRAGAPTAGDALRTLGEPAFRALEAELARELFDAARKEPPRPAVIALGGGTPTAAGASIQLERARDEGRVVIALLEASIDTLAERLAGDPVDRPPLTTLPPKEELMLLASRRLDDYRRLAHRRLDTTGLPIVDAVAALQSLWSAPETVA